MCANCYRNSRSFPHRNAFTHYSLSNTPTIQFNCEYQKTSAKYRDKKIHAIGSQVRWIVVRFFSDCGGKNTDTQHSGVSISRMQPPTKHQVRFTQTRDAHQQKKKQLSHLQQIHATLCASSERTNWLSNRTASQCRLTFYYWPRVFYKRATQS